MPKSKITIEIDEDVDVRELTIRITPSQIELSTDTRLSESLGGSGEKEGVRREYKTYSEALHNALYLGAAVQFDTKTGKYFLYE